MIRVALIGCGTWGKNLLRVLLASPRAQVVAVADTSPARRAVAASLAPDARIVPTLDDAVAEGVEAVLIAAPPHAHAGLVMRALAAGADVFVEKPLATRAADADRCVARAAALGRIAMVGHLLRYHPAVERLLDLAASGALGELRRLEATRLSIAGDRSASALWTLGPHDFSVLHALDPGPIHTLTARAAASGDPVLVETSLASGFAATVALSRVGSVKERKLRVVGTEATAIFDDVRMPDRVVVASASGIEPITVAWREPLALEIDHFLRCVERGEEPRSPFSEGAAVVRALSIAEERCEVESPPIPRPLSPDPGGKGSGVFSPLPPRSGERGLGG